MNFRFALSSLFLGMLIITMMAGCGKQLGDDAPGDTPDDTPPAEPTAETANKLLILCGNSFKTPMDVLVAEFNEKHPDVEVEMSIGGSEDLLPHVKAQSVGDLYVTHDPFIDLTKEANSLSDFVTVGFNAPVLVVAKGNPLGIKSIDDLAKPDIGVAITDKNYSTAGEMVDVYLDEKDAAEPGYKEKFLANVGDAMFRSHSNIGTQIKLGHRDAGIMWGGVAHNFNDALEVIPAPYPYKEEIKVAVAGLSYSKNPEMVKEFLDFLRERGPTVFKEHGYTKGDKPADPPIVESVDDPVDEPTE